MKITFTSKGNAECSPSIWRGTIKPIRLNNPVEVEVSARGSCFHVIVGRHAYGNYLCVPNWDIGIELSSLSDRFWNKERLVNTGLGAVDACTIADALVSLSEHVTL